MAKLPEPMAKLPNIHPGEVIREDFLVPWEMTQRELARGLRMSPRTIGEILNGRRSITPATALRLSRFLGCSPRFWLGLQAAYDLEEATERLASELAAIQPCERSGESADLPLQQEEAPSLEAMPT